MRSLALVLALITASFFLGAVAGRHVYRERVSARLVEVMRENECFEPLPGTVKQFLGDEIPRDL